MHGKRVDLLHLYLFWTLFGPHTFPGNAEAGLFNPLSKKMHKKRFVDTCLDKLVIKTR
jgi:hypothetical protein